MSIRFCIIIIVLLLISSLNAGELTLGTFNIRSKQDIDSINGNGWEKRMPAVVKVIQSNDFDALGLQEVLPVQLKGLLRHLTDYRFIGVGRNNGKTSGQYVPIFYNHHRISVLDSGFFWFSETDSLPSRGWDAKSIRMCTFGRFQYKENGSVFWIFNVHLDHVGKQARLESAKLLLDKIKSKVKDEPVLVMGDWNAHPESPPYELFVNSGLFRDAYTIAKTHEGGYGTFNRFKVNAQSEERIDYIFVSDSIDVSYYSVWGDTYRDSTGKERNPSDHYPVLIKADLKR